MSRSAPFVLAALAFGLAGSAQAQERDVPPGAILKVLDIVFRTEEIGGTVADLQVKETDTELRIELAADVLFDFDKSTLQPAAEETLAKAAAIVRERGKGSARIEGHTDSVGNEAYNQRLSQRRAESVRQWFVGRGFRPQTLTARGYGETRPVAPNAKPDGSDDPEGRRKNRRVEIVIGKTG